MDVCAHIRYNQCKCVHCCRWTHAAFVSVLSFILISYTHHMMLREWHLFGCMFLVQNVFVLGIRTITYSTEWKSIANTTHDCKSIEKYFKIEIFSNPFLSICTYIIYIYHARKTKKEKLQKQHFICWWKFVVEQIDGASWYQ